MKKIEFDYMYGKRSGQGIGRYDYNVNFFEGEGTGTGLLSFYDKDTDVISGSFKNRHRSHMSKKGINPIVISSDDNTELRMGEIISDDGDWVTAFPEVRDNLLKRKNKIDVEFL
jgi:hypothetical protein